jgi:ATP-dependent RNA helicase DeaD
VPSFKKDSLTTFKQLGISAPILKAIAELGFEKATEIQEQSIPALITDRRDFIGLAQTGTGKTAAFGLPLIEQLDSSAGHTQALILAPTRELGKQIAEQLKQFSKYAERLNMIAVYGGAPISKQMKELRKPQHIIIATPGRLLDLIRRKSIQLDKIDFVVLDEADEMLNMGFKEDIDKILSFTPENKNTWLFSATMPGEIRRIVKKYMKDPLEVKVNTDNEVNANIEHRYVVVNPKNKAEALMRFFDAYPDMRSLVFCRTRRDTQELADLLVKSGHSADSLHGDLSQGQRDRVMSNFRNHKVKTLVATDVAARGIDVDDITHVFHHTLSDETAYYTHRSGRTARAGKEGLSIAFVGQRDKNRVKRLEKSLEINFKPIDIPHGTDILETRLTEWAKSVLEARPKKEVPEELLDHVNLLFANLTKEELTAKLLALELEEVQDRGTQANLNTDFTAGGGGGGKRGKKSYGGGGRNRRGGGGGKRSKYGRRNRSHSSSNQEGKPKKSKHRKGGKRKEW